MSYLVERAPGGRRITWVNIGVRNEAAAEVVADAKSYAQAQGVTFGSLVMEALSKYMDDLALEARANAAEASSRE